MRYENRSSSDRPSDPEGTGRAVGRSTVAAKPNANPAGDAGWHFKEHCPTTGTWSGGNTLVRILEGLPSAWLARSVRELHT